MDLDLKIQKPLNDFVDQPIIENFYKKLSNEAFLIKEIIKEKPKKKKLISLTESNNINFNLNRMIKIKSKLNWKEKKINELNCQNKFDKSLKYLKNIQKKNFKNKIDIEKKGENYLKNKNKEIDLNFKRNKNFDFKKKETLENNFKNPTVIFEKNKNPKKQIIPEKKENNSKIFFEQNNYKFFNNFKEFKIDNLELNSKIFFFYLLRRKFLNRSSVIPVHLQNINHLYFQYKEKKKTFFKHERSIISFILNQFIKKKTQKYNSEVDKELAFYSIYFGKTAKKNNIPLNFFFKPRNFKIQNPIHNSYSREYIELILKSEKFKKDFIFYLRFQFKKDYEKDLEFSIKKMIKLFLKKFREKFIQLSMSFNDNNEILNQVAYEFFFKGYHVIPMTEFEISESIKITLDLIGFKK